MIRTLYPFLLSFLVAGGLALGCGGSSNGDGDDGASGSTGGAGTSSGGQSSGGGSTQGGSGAVGSGGSPNAGSPNGGTNNGGGGSGGSANGGSGASGSGAAGSGGTASGAAGMAGDGGASAGPLDCDYGKIVCRRAEPVCPAMQVARVEGSCYGECVPIEECGCMTAEQCPHAESYTCHRSAMRCGPYL